MPETAGIASFYGRFSSVTLEVMRKHSRRQNQEWRAYSASSERLARDLRRHVSKEVRSANRKTLDAIKTQGDQIEIIAQLLAR